MSLEDWPEAHTEYSDYKGTVAFEDSSGADFAQLEQKLGMNTERYLGVGIEFSRGDLPGQENTYWVTVYAVDTSDGLRDMDAIQQYLTTHEGVLPVTRFHATVDADELFQYLHRFCAVGFLLGLEGRADRIDIREDVDLSG